MSVSAAGDADTITAGDPNEPLVNDDKSPSLGSPEKPNADRTESVVIPQSTGQPMDRPMLDYLLYRLVWLPAAVLSFLLLMALGLLIALSWQDSQRLDPVQKHITQLDRLRTVNLEINALALESLAKNSLVGEGILGKLADEIDRLNAQDSYLVESTADNLQDIVELLVDPDISPQRALVEGANRLRQVVSRETSAYAQLLASVQQDARQEGNIATGVAIGFPLLMLLMVYPVRRSLLTPLRHLSVLMTAITQQNYDTLATPESNPLLQPLFESYNQMVTRLRELELEHQTRERSLVAAVQDATGALLEQQNALARAQRLAAVGELAASLAHDLRNPLAGAQMACRNLRQDVTDPDHGERLEVIGEELQRVTQLLNSLLSSARQIPETAQDVDIARQVGELFRLVRYQLPEGILLEQRITEALHCFLPPAGFRQLLLNLIMNSAQALAKQAGTIRVSAERRDARLILTVCDDGPGFPVELLEGGIRPFASWRQNGTGLGLSMVRRFVHELGGDLDIGNLPQGGACVTLRLPCRGQHG
ncbi:MAG: HAMP domain-containing histidine kinase [Gammaproteobacteria bacterium]|nr:HAMP domain-containing histidine kinase [Gammaproteobacteria bacterium]